MLDMSTEGEVQLNLTNMDCVGQDFLCKVVSPNYSETPKQDIEVYKIGYYREPDYIEADSESQSEKVRREPFCVTGKDSDYIDIDNLY